MSSAAQEVPIKYSPSFMDVMNRGIKKFGSYGFPINIAYTASWLATAIFAGRMMYRSRNNPDEFWKWTSAMIVHSLLAGMNIYNIWRETYQFLYVDANSFKYFCEPNNLSTYQRRTITSAPFIMKGYMCDEKECSLKWYKTWGIEECPKQWYKENPFNSILCKNRPPISALDADC